jgi:tRNA (guanine-N7-)-methyltransferase
MSRGRQIVRLKLRPLSAQAKELLLDWEPGELYSHPERFLQLTSNNLFGNQNPLEVEIGPGSGEYLCYLAGSKPGTNFLGIEVSRRSAVACAALAAETGLANFRVLRTDFKLLRPLLPAKGWAKVYLHFPDPPHKNADEKRRIFDRVFLDQMAFTLATEGQISVASDKQEFLVRMLKLAESDPRFRVTHPERYLQGMDAPVKSRFQLFWERKGVQPLRFILSKSPAL